VGSDGRKISRVRWGSRGAEGRCHGNQFWDAICYNWLCVNDSDDDDDDDDDGLY